MEATRRGRNDADNAQRSPSPAALVGVAPWNALRQRLREWLYDGKDRAAPCQAQLEVQGGFAWLLRWFLSGTRSETLTLACDRLTARRR